MIRRATEADLPELLPRMAAFNALEGIAITPAKLDAALRRLLAEPALGWVWLFEPGPIGYAVVTLGYDLEYGGHDAYLTEIWVDEPARGRGVARAALDGIAEALRGHVVAL